MEERKRQNRTMPERRQSPPAIMPLENGGDMCVPPISILKLCGSSGRSLRPWEASVSYAEALPVGAMPFSCHAMSQEKPWNALKVHASSKKISEWTAGQFLKDDSKSLKLATEVFIRWNPSSWHRRYTA